MNERQYQKFTVKAALELASPSTWVVAALPVLVGVASALALSPLVPAVFDLRAVAACLLMLLMALLMQSALNSCNSCRDHKVGNGSGATIHDIRDASIINNKIDDRYEINQKYARAFAFVLLGGAAVCGFVAALLSSLALLPVGLVAVVLLVLYAAEPKPVLALPLGEAVFGIVIGGFITIATYYAITLVLSPLAVLMAVPPVLTIALVKQTSNSCNIQRDIRAGRRSLPILIELERSIQLAKALAWGTLVFMVIWFAALDVIIWRSLWLLAADAVFAFGLYLVFRQRLEKIGLGTYDLPNRRMMMRNITGFCRNVNIAWLAICLLGYALGDVMGLA